jgi:hypothetical protein
MNKLLVLAIASAMLFSDIIGAAAFERSSVDRYSIKGIKIGMTIAEVREVLPELQVLHIGIREDYFELHRKRPSKVKNEYLASIFEGWFFNEQLTEIKITEDYDKLDCKQIRNRLHEKYGKRKFVRQRIVYNKKRAEKYIVEVRSENHTEKISDPVKGDVISKFEVVEINDSNKDFRFRHKITCYELDKNTPAYGEGSVHGLLVSETIKKTILDQEARDNESDKNLRREQERNKRKDIAADEIDL